MKIAIGCDPNAVDLKIYLINSLQSKGHAITDFGSEDPIYANIAFKVAEKIVQGEFDRGLLICGTGIGMTIAANKVKGAYAALISDCYSAERASKSNNAKIACLGANILGLVFADRLVQIWLNSEFDPDSPSNNKVKRIMEFENETNI